MTTADPAVKTLPVVEVFGPTVQGEGPLAGVPTHFVRLGYCDYRCSWCDSMYAVDPEQVRAGAERLTHDEVRARVDALDPGPSWVTLSGGNPAIHDCADLVDQLHGHGYRVAVETQGSVWRPWLVGVDQLVVSPKPPSSGMATENREAQTRRFLSAAMELWPDYKRALKVVVFDDTDFDWARRLVVEYGGRWECYLSAGTPQGLLNDTITVDEVLGRYAWLCERVAHDPSLSSVAVLPQLHVLAWGTRRGV